MCITLQAKNKSSVCAQLQHKIERLWPFNDLRTDDILTKTNATPWANTCVVYHFQTNIIVRNHFSWFVSCDK
jgi:hypothetical protein